MAVTFYPNQRVSVDGTELILVQSANVDFSIKRQEVFEFGSAFAVDYVQTDAATVNLNFEYALLTGANATQNKTTIGLGSIGDVITDTVGKTYVITGAGTLTVPGGVINNYSLKAAVGSIPTVTVGVTATNATYAAGSPASARSATSATAATPQSITLVYGNSDTEIVSRNVSLNLDIPRQYVYKLGSLTPIATITNGAAKVTVEAEVIMDQYDLDDTASKDLKINVGAAEFSAANMQLVSFNPKTTVNEVAVSTVRWEGIIKQSADLVLGG